MKYNFNENGVIFGGTFDPIHKGHLNVICYLLKNKIAESVMLVPSGIPPFKKDSVRLQGEERLNLCRLAIADFEKEYGKEYSDRVFINCDEIYSPECSYTSCTIEKIKKDYNIQNKVNFVIGDDVVQTLTKWHRAEYLKNNVRFILFHRIGGKSEAIENLVKDGYEIRVISNPCFEYSSSAVRERNIYDALSPSVKEEYIKILNKKNIT